MSEITDEPDSQAIDKEKEEEEDDTSNKEEPMVTESEFEASKDIVIKEENKEDELEETTTAENENEAPPEIDAENNESEVKVEIKAEIINKDEDTVPSSEKDEGTPEPPLLTEEPMQVDTTLKEQPKEEEGSEDTEETRCYCGRERDLDVLELQCGFCLRYYHVGCISCYLGKSNLRFMTNYQFFCKRCNPTGLENFQKKQASFSQMCQTAIANLHHINPEATFFSKDKDIIPFIDKNWEALTTGPRRVKQTWHTTIAKTMIKENELFLLKEDSMSEHHFALACQELSSIGPNYENIFKTTSVFKDNYRFGGVFSDAKSRGTKRKAPGDGGMYGMKLKKGEVSSTNVTPLIYPIEHPFNKDSYRYILAEPDPHAPNRQAYDDSLEWAGKPIPGYLYRAWLDKEVLLALHDRAPQLRVSEERLHVTGEKGYSMIRATHGVNRGSWYYEATITEMPEGTATRIGWAQSLANLQAPCGYDKFSYSWRSRCGTRFHQSIGKRYSIEYGVGDVLGFYIELPETEICSHYLPNTSKDKPLVKFKNHLYYEEKDSVSETEKTLKPLQGSKIALFKNGVDEGSAWSDIFGGNYFPAVSLYKNATVQVNFGPNFTHPPKDYTYKPMCERTTESYVEHVLRDVLYHIDHEGNLPEF